ncbi:MAG: hypothetical protein LBT89_11440, partial [Planctomycetaceae bacterium]|nr:hypothetical protein [Planctomycetaceae bacterium]
MSENKEQQIRVLEQELETIRQKTARGELVSQNLRTVQYKLDVMLERFSRMHDYAKDAYAVQDNQSLFQAIAEGIADIMQIEIGAVFEINFTDQQMILLSQVNLEIEDTVFSIPPDFWNQIKPDPGKSDAVCLAAVDSEPWLSMGLSSVIFTPFYD